MSFFGNLLDAVNQSVDESVSGIDDAASESVFTKFEKKICFFVYLPHTFVFRRILNH